MTHTEQTELIWREMHERLLAYIRPRVAGEADADDILLYRGQLAAGSVAFDAPVLAFDGIGVGDSYQRVTLAVDDGGVVWVAGYHQSAASHQAWVNRPGKHRLAAAAGVTWIVHEPQYTAPVSTPYPVEARLAA